jgi:hypothetical protein
LRVGEVKATCGVFGTASSALHSAHMDMSAAGYLALSDTPNRQLCSAADDPAALIELTT